MAAAETARLIAELVLQDRQFRAALGRAERGTAKLERRFGNLGRNTRRGAREAGRNIERGIGLGVTAAVGALAFAVHEATEQESAITGIAKTVDGNIDAVVDDLKKLSTAIPLSFGELAGIAELGGAMGVAKEDLVAFTEQVAILGTTTNVSTEEAATALGQLQNVIGLTGDEFDNFAASLVDLGNKGSSTEAQILEIAKRSGSAAKLAGVAKEETLGWAAAAANLGLGEELAGTALQKFFITTRKAIANGDASFEMLAKTAGMTGREFKRAFQKDAGGALESFVAGLGELGEGERIRRIEKLFGKGSGMTRLLTGLAGNVDNLSDSLDTSRTAWIEGTAAQAEAEKRFKTSESLFKRLGNAVSLAAATIGAELLPVLVDLAQEGIDWLTAPATQRGIKAFAKDLGSGARELAKWVKQVDFSGIADALKTAAGFGRQLLDAFLGMPAWVQTAVVTGWGLNKLTGGALTSIFGDLASGLIKGVLGINAGIVNVNGPVAMGPGAAAGAAGGLGRFRPSVGGLLMGGLAIAGWSVALGVWEETNKRSTEQAQTASKNLDAMLAQKPNLAAMSTSLAAVETGIKQIESNPLLTVVQGDALNELRAMREKLQGEIRVKARPIIEERAPVNAALNQASIGSREAQRAPIRADPKTSIVPAVNATTAAVKNAQSIASRENSAQKSELGLIKAGLATLGSNLKPVPVKAQATKNAIDNARSIASRENSQTKTAVQATKNAVRNAQSVGSRENSAIKAAQVTTTGATRTAGQTVALAMANAASRIVGAVNALDLSVNVTTVNRTSTVNNRYGPSGGSSTYERVPGAG